ncbi:MAG TPA: hypothetical protein VJ866_21505 [Pyrinomonadaceae bacterium]|nr:hypothetical protein [Pyrinomonadaceae bacterium]
MRVFLLPLLLLLPAAAAAQQPAPNASDAPLPVLSFKWSKSTRTSPHGETPQTGPAAAVTGSDKNFERNRRVNDPAGVRDPKADTIDARSAALEKSVQESRSNVRGPSEVYEYHAKVRNDFKQSVEVVFWEYQFAEPSNADSPSRRQFLCGVSIKPGKEKELLALIGSGPTPVVSAESLGANAAANLRENAVVNRVEYSDGTIWQRKGWNYAEVRSAVARATSTPWSGEMCRGL